jgi:hypothetical protein
VNAILACRPGWVNVLIEERVAADKLQPL